MTETLLSRLVESCIVAGCVRDEDVTVLSRDLLPEGVFSPEEAEALIAIERGVTERCETWSAFFVDMLTDYMVWNRRPSGKVDADAALWLLQRLVAAGQPPKGNARFLLVAIVREADEVAPKLVETAYGLVEAPAARAAAAMTVGWLDSAGISA